MMYFISILIFIIQLGRKLCYELSRRITGMTKTASFTIIILPLYILVPAQTGMGKVYCFTRVKVTAPTCVNTRGMFFLFHKYICKKKLKQNKGSTINIH